MSGKAIKEIGQWVPGECTALPTGMHPTFATVGETRIVERVTDGKRKNVAERFEKEVPYMEWDGRCRVCFP